MKQVREKRGVTNAALLAEAVNHHLDELVREMQKRGLSREKGPRSLVRLPLSKKEKTLDKLRSASILVQIPVTVLMAACIKSAISDSPASGKRTRKAKVTS